MSPREILARADHDYHGRICSPNCATCLDAADNALAALEAEGYKVVPIDQD